MSFDITQKIDNFAKAHYKELKNEESIRNSQLTKYDVAQYMLSKGVLKESEFISWMNTNEGFESSQLSQRQAQQLKNSDIWSFSKQGESYLDLVSGQVDDKKGIQSIYGLEINQKAFQENPIYQHIMSVAELMDTPDVSYEDLMNAIEMKSLSNEEQLELSLKISGQKYYEAKQNNDKEAMKEYLFQGLNLVFAVIDENIGITDFKEFLKSATGLKFLTESIDKFVDDGDKNNLTFAEKSWNIAKGAGNTIDSMIGVKGIGFAATLSLASELAISYGIGQLFSAVLQGFYAYQGLVLTTEGVVEAVNAETELEAQQSGQKLASGGLLLYGTYKSAKQGYQNYKVQQDKLTTELTEAEKILGLKGDYTKQDVKNAYRKLVKTQHTDKGGTIDGFDKITDARDLILNNFDSKTFKTLKSSAKQQPQAESSTKNLPSKPVGEIVKSDIVGPTAAVSGLDGGAVAQSDAGNYVEQPQADALTPMVQSLDVNGFGIVLPPVGSTSNLQAFKYETVTKIEVIAPKVNHFEGYRNPDGTVNTEKIAEFFITERRALESPDNVVVKQLIDGYPRRDIAQLAEKYPLFTQHFVNAMENGLAVSTSNKKYLKEGSISDEKLFEYAEDYLGKGLKFEDITDLNEFVSKVRINHNMGNVIKSYSVETQQRYIDYIYHSRQDDYYYGMRFVVENIPSEEFLVECFDNPSLFKKIAITEREINAPFNARLASKKYEITPRNYYNSANFYKIKTQMTLMKLYYPENYEKLINSKGFRAVVWNFNTRTLKVLENMQYDKPVTDTNLAGVDVTEILESKNFITPEMAKGNVAVNFNLSDRLGGKFRENIRAYSDSQGYRCDETTISGGGTKFTIRDASGKQIKTFETGKLNPNKIGKVEQVFYDSYGKPELTVTYTSIDNTFVVKSRYKTETFNSYKDYKNHYSRYNLDSEINSFVWVNDEGFIARKF